MEELDLPGPEAEAARQQARERVVRFEKDINDLVKTAREYLGIRENRLDGMVIYFRDVIEELGDREAISVDQTLIPLVTCVWLLTEAREEIEQLRNALPFEGNRRTGPLGT